mgnify:CR=1 FL=1
MSSTTRYRLGGSVGLYDTTLRDGEQTVGVVLDPEQKLEIARLLDELGIDRIEAGFPRVSQDDWDAVRLISDAGLRAEIWGFSRAVPADLEALVELGVRASVIESPISDLKLEAIGVSREKMLRPDHRTRCASRPSTGSTRRSSASTRRAREPAFYEQVYRCGGRGGREGGRRRRTRSGSPRRRRVADLVGRTVEWVGPDVPVHFHGHNDFGLATAAAVAARAGGRALGARDDQRHGRAGGQREPRRGGAHAATRSTASSRTSASSGFARSPSACASSRATRSSPGSR